MKLLKIPILPMSTATPQSLLAWRTVLVTYLALFGALLAFTRGYPYVFDNNESYSSLWHARSLYENGVAQTKGLTDEVFAHHPEASPYIHSHQGNFPRLFTFILYTLGLRTIGPQIWVTTFTVGLAALWLAFRFLSRLGNPLYAALTCGLLMTDYLFFTQWQVGLYNIWHGFFFFSSLVCVQALGDSEHRGRWFALAFVNFAALFYWEYVFTAFVIVLCGLFAVGLYWRRFQLVLLLTAAMGAGAALAAGVLLAQLSAYMGWANVMEDVRLTLTARNAAADPVLLERVTSFYREHHIIFWHNFLDATPLRNLPTFWGSLVEFHLKYYGPAWLYAATVLTAGWWLGSWRRPGDWRGGRPAEPLPRMDSRGLDLRPISDWTKALLTAACLASLLDPHLSANPILLSLPLTLLLGYCWTGRWWGWRRLGWSRFVPILAFAILAPWAARGTSGMMDPSLMEQWLVTPGGPVLQSLTNPLLISISLLGLSVTALGPGHLLGRLRGARLAGVLSFLVCGVVAYAATYRIFTGYIFSGYLHRFVPLTVFLIAPVLGLALYLGFQAALRTFPLAYQSWASVLQSARTRRQMTASRHRAWSALGLTSALNRTLPALCVAGVLTGLAASWTLLQATYVRIAPPDNYAFLQRLEKKPFKGHSFVSNTYPAPMAARMGQWGYADTTLFSGTLTLGPDGFKVERELKYLWFADRDNNPAYLKPDFALTVIHPPNFGESLNRYLEWQTQDTDYPPRVENTGLVRRARSLPQPFLKHQLVDSDGRRFSAVKLDWDYPPYLRPLEEERRLIAARYSLIEKMALSESGQELRRQWRIEVEPIADSGPVRLLGATCDSTPVFTALELTAPLEGRKYRQIVYGDRVRLDFARHPGAGRVWVTVNDNTELLDLSAGDEQTQTFEVTSSQPHGRFTSLPAFSPGSHVRVRPLAGGVAVTYDYAHQESLPEGHTVIRVYQEVLANRWQVADEITFLVAGALPVRLEEFRRENPDTLAEYARSRALGDTRTYQQWLDGHLTATPAEWNRPGILSASIPAASPPGAIGGIAASRFVPLLRKTERRLQISVTPGTSTKSGPEYFSVPFTTTASDTRPASAVADSIRAFLYGRLKIRLRFPVHPLHGVEPLLATGLNEAGDFIYVIYHSPTHVRIGFDHWYKGGPLTAPIPLDRTVEHELEISLGSLFPPAADVVFYGTPPEVVAAIKRQVSVRLDGQTVLATEAETYESPLSQVTVGRNTIKGTSSGPEFSGEIISVERLWFE